MCLIAFALAMRDDCPLLIASNRDEFWDRPTRPLATWTSASGMTIHSGRDERAGGTWLGFNATGRVAMLTNVRRTEMALAPLSRGELAMRWLDGPAGCPDWQTLVHQVNPGHYAGFNLVLGDQEAGSWVWLSNHQAPTNAAASRTRLPPGWSGHELGAGVYGLSNAGLDTPWRKTLCLKSATAQALAFDPWDHASTSALLRALQQSLPTHEGADWQDEPAGPLAHPFVYAPENHYGTRSSLIARHRINGSNPTLELEEWTYPPGQLPSAEAAYKRISISTWGMPTSR